MSATLIKVLSFVFFLVISTSSLALQPEVNFSPKDKWVKPLSFPQKIIVENSAGIDYLVYEHQINLIKSDKQQFFRIASQVSNQQGLSQIAKVEVRFSPAYETLTFHNITILRDGKQIDVLNPEKIKLYQNEQEMKNNIYQEDWNALFILEDVRVGDIVDYSYRIDGANPILGTKRYGGYSINWGAPIAHQQFRLLSAKDTPIFFKVFNSNLEIDKRSTALYDEYTLIQQNVDAVYEEDMMPNWFTPYGYLSYSEYKDWNEVNRWALGLYDVNLTIPTELKQIIDELKTEDKKIQISKAIQWIQDHIRYFGIEFGSNSHQPSLPFDTFSRKYGDCKDKTMLLIAALKYLGVEAYPALVSTKLNKNMDLSLPSPGEFNHVIVQFELADKVYWVDATVSYQRGSLDAMSFPDLNWGLVVKNGTQTLKEIVPSSQQTKQAMVDVERRISLNSNAADTINIQTSYRGWRAEEMRSYFASVDDETVNKDYLDYMVRQFSTIKAVKKIEIVDDESSNEIVVKEWYQADELTTPSKPYVRFESVPLSITSQLTFAEIRQRKMPFSLPYYIDINVNTEIELADSYKLNWFKEGEYAVQQNKWFSYYKKTSKNGDTLKINDRYTSKKTDVNGNDYLTYQKLLEEIDKPLATVVLVKPKHSAEERTKNLIKSLMSKG